jgi:hypothetical protein
MHIFTGLIRDFGRFARDQIGNTAILFSLSAAVMIGGGGAAIDYANTLRIQSEVEATLDAAVLAGVGSSLKDDLRLLTAQTYFKQYQKESGVTYDVAFQIENGNLVGKVIGDVPTTLLGVLGVKSMPVNARSVGVSGEALEPACFMAMHPTRKHTLELKDSVSVTAPDCNIYGNSNHFDDVVDPHTTQNYLTGKFIAAIGGGHHYLANVTPPVEFGTRLVPDPLSNLDVPAPGTCLQTNFKVSGGSMVLPQGHYCGGLTLESNAHVTLEQGGTYFISGGAFSISSATLLGEDVTIFLTDASAKVAWQDAVVRISAKKTGDYAGIVVFGERVDTTNDIVGSTVDTYGAFYMPKGAFTWDNVGAPEITAKWQSFIVDGVSWIGSGTIRYNFDLANSDIPFPAGLVAIPRPSEVRLIE